MPLLLDLNGLSRILLPGRSRTNPAGIRPPEEYQKVLDTVGRWFDTDKKKLLGGNTKLDASASKGILGGNLKLDQSAEEYWDTVGIALLPHKQARAFVDEFRDSLGLSDADVERVKRANLCPGASEGCALMCLTSAGQMAQDGVTAAQMRKTLLYIFHKPVLSQIIAVSIAKQWQKCINRSIKDGVLWKPGIRLNITSDMAWEQNPVDISPEMAHYLTSHVKKAGFSIAPGHYRNLMEVFPHVQFYDYTKVEGRMKNFLTGKNWPANYYLTWSMSEDTANRRMAFALLKMKKQCPTTVTIPFARRGKKAPSKAGKGGREAESLPSTVTFIDDVGGEGMLTVPVLDADIHDVRPLDKKGWISGLHFKVPQAGKKSGLKHGMHEVKKAALSRGFIVPTGGADNVVIYTSGPKEEQKIHINPRRR